MRSILLALGLIVVGMTYGATANAKDIRIIGGKQVDLQQIYDWEKNPKGDRPLKHWKLVRITGLGKEFTPSNHVVQVIIEGVQQTVAVRNMPKTLAAKLARWQERKSRLTIVEQELRSALKASELAAAKVGAAYSKASPSFTNAVVAREQQKQNMAEDAAKRESAAQLELTLITREVAKLEEEVCKEPFMAMIIAEKYKGKLQWDTGLKK